MGYLCFLSGVIFGSIITTIMLFIRCKRAGVLRIDHSNPEKDTYRFDISDLDALDKAKRIILKIDNHADLSQK